MNEFLGIPNFGCGVSTCSTHETSWVALTPDPKDPNKPAFPKCLEWLRNNQLKDGNWGSEYPNSPYERIICTASAIIALKTWNNASDVQQINNGIVAYKQMVEKLKDSDPALMTVAFETIWPSLVDRALKVGIDLDNEFVERFRQIKSKKIAKLIEMKKHLDERHKKKVAWLDFPDIWEQLYDKSELRELVNERDTLGNCYSSTAYAFRIDPTLDRCFAKLRKVVEENNGGVPAYGPLEVFGLSWSLWYLQMAGFDTSEDKFKVFVDRLESYWNSNRGNLGGCLTLEPDADCTAGTLAVLNCSGRLIDPKNCEQLFRYWRTDHFATYEHEQFISLSINFNCLAALKRYQDLPKIKNIMNLTVDWIRKQANYEDRYLFRDKWHCSPYYALSRAVFALEGIDNQLAEKCIEQMIVNQKEDQGWGFGDRSSLEETALVILSLGFWQRTGHIDNADKVKHCLISGRKYLDANKNGKLWPFWLLPTNYCLTDAVQTIIYAANNLK